MSFLLECSRPVDIISNYSIIYKKKLDQVNKTGSAVIFFKIRIVRVLQMIRVVQVVEMVEVVQVVKEV